MNEKISDLYYDPSFPASFSSLGKFYKEARKVIKNLTKHDLKKWSLKSNTYTIHKSARKNFRRERINTSRIDYLWEIDLVDVSRLKDFNDGYTFLLVCIDTFSKYVWIRALKKKTGKDTTSAFLSILNASIRTPSNIRYDQGTEFKPKDFQHLLKLENRRFNRTFKNKMYRYFTASNTLRYIDVLKELVTSYNSTYLRSIKMKPIQVNKANSDIMRRNLLPKSKGRKDKTPSSLLPGDYVRISRRKRTFQKEHAPTWTEEIFKIKKILKKSTPITYIIEDLLDEEISGKVYKEQLQKVDMPLTFVIDKIHKRRTRKGKREALVRWRGYPVQFTQWIPLEDIQEIPHSN